MTSLTQWLKIIQHKNTSVIYDFKILIITRWRMLCEPPVMLRVVFHGFLRQCPFHRLFGKRNSTAAVARLLEENNIHSTGHS